MAGPVGFEPTTYRSEACRAIQAAPRAREKISLDPNKPHGGRIHVTKSPPDTKCDWPVLKCNGAIFGFMD